jgi:cyclophilin family peptidyl-prolyl cis-trans isomerase
MYGRKLIQHNATEESSETYDKLLLNDLLGLPYMPDQKGVITTSHSDRGENPIVFLEISAGGGRQLRNGQITQPQILGRMYVELRKDLVPVASANFMALCSGIRGWGEDGVKYHYQGTRIHRIVKDLMWQSGDLLDTKGDCSRSIYNNGGLFRDESFILRHTGAGCLSYCNRGPDTNGSLFQMSFTHAPIMDGRNVVFGCLASKESYDTLTKINSYGTPWGETKEEIRISDCGIAYP